MPPMSRILKIISISILTMFLAGNARAEDSVRDLASLPILHSGNGGLNKLWFDTHRFPEVAARIYRHCPGTVRQRLLLLQPYALATGVYTGRGEDTSEFVRHAEEINGLINAAKMVVELAALPPLEGEMVWLDTVKFPQIARRIHSHRPGPRPGERFLLLDLYSLGSGIYTGRGESTVEVTRHSRIVKQTATSAKGIATMDDLIGFVDSYNDRRNCAEFLLGAATGQRP